MRQVVSASVSLWVALGSWLITASPTFAQNRYAVFHVENTTSDLTLRYRVRWGANAEWSAEWVLKPHRWNYHWYRYATSDQNSSPTPEIRFVSGIKRDRSWTTLSLQAYASPVQSDHGRRYSFVKRTDNSGEEYVDLRAWSREAEQAFAATAGVDREEAIRALRSFKLGSTVTPKRLRELNDFPNLEPPDKPISPVPSEVQDLIRNERIKHALLEQEMIAAADKVLTATTLTAKERAAKGLRLWWLYGPVTSPLRRENSVDDLGGVRLIGHLEADGAREINVIFPITYHASDRNYESKGGPVLLWGGDNCRIEARLFSTGDVRADYAYQSFSIGTEKGAIYMRPGFYLDEKTGVLVNRYITSKALGTSCMDCHAKGPNFKSEDLKLMSTGNLTAMRGFSQFLDQAYHLGATKLELLELRERMAADPASLLPLSAYRKANEESWIQRYPQFAKHADPDRVRR
jgi:hypothetical protein